MERLWMERDLYKFLQNFKDLVVASNDRSEHLHPNMEQLIHRQVTAAVLILSKSWNSTDHALHEVITTSYLSVQPVIGTPQKKLAISCNQYVTNVLCTKIMESATIPRIQECLNLSLRLFTADDIETDQTFHVEDTLLSQSRLAVDECILQRISVEFVRKLYIFPLEKSREYPKLPGVYLIYYVGDTPLYDGLIRYSKDRPVYVGMSESSISNRLGKHCANIDKAKDLKVADFIVRFMIADIKYYASCIEGMLIEYFSPLWNDNTIKFSFGNALANSSNWHNYHIEQDRDTIAHIIRLVSDYTKKTVH